MQQAAHWLQQEKSTLAIEDAPAPSVNSPPPPAYPEGLFGRAAELEAVLRAASAPAGARLALLHGPPGIGKSTLLAALRREIRRRGGWCAIGVYADQPLPIPYSGLAGALADLARQLLAEPAVRLRPLQQQLRASLGSGSALLASLAPDFAPLFGAQPAPPPGDSGHQERLVAAMRLVLGLLAGQGGRPVLCLDDLQWADRSSLEILRRLLLESPSPDLLVVVALRSESSSDPTNDAGVSLAGSPAVQVTLAEIRRQRPDCLDLALGPLDRPAVAGLLRAAMVDETAIDVEQSAGLLHAISHGNPLLLRQALHAGGLAPPWQRDAPSARWVWNPEAAAGLPASGQLRAMLALRLRRLDAATLDLLTAAACAGREIDPPFLAALLQVDGSIVADALRRGAAAGLLIATSDGAGPSQPYRFAHGEVQRILLERLDAEQRRNLHRRIGDRLLRITHPGGRQEALFLIAGHLAVALQPERDAARAAEMAALYVEAASAALALGAIHTAGDYMQRTLAWVEVVPGGWRLHYTLHLEVHELAARIALYTGDYAGLARHSQAVLQMAQAPSDKAGVYKSCITGATLQGDYERALDLLHTALSELGVRMPRLPGAGHVLAAYAQTRLALRGRSDTVLRTLPTTAERLWWVIGDLVTSAFMAMQWGGQQLLMAYLALQGVRWSVQHGHTPLSVIAYALYSVLLTNRFGDRAAGARFGQIALELSERPENHHQRAGVLLTLNSLVVHQAEPLAATIEPLRQARRLALQQGDVRLATDCTLAYISHAQLSGAPVDALARELAAMLAELEPFGETAPLLVGRMLLQNLLNLAGEGDAPHTLSGSVCNAPEVLARLQQTGNRFGLNAFYSMTATLCLLFGEPQAAVQAADEAQRLAASVNIGLFAEAVRAQVDALARLACCQAAGSAGRRQLLRAIGEDIKQLQRWAARSPANHGHRLHQVLAELAWVRGERARAAQHYADAWRLASEQGFVHDEGGIAELAAHHCLQSGQWELASLWRRRAVAAYARWGSRAKLRYLQHTLPALPSDLLAQEPAVQEPAVQEPAAGANEGAGGLPLAAERLAHAPYVVADLHALGALGAHAGPRRVMTHLLAALLARLPATRAAFLLRQDQRTVLFAVQRAGQPAPDFPELALEDDEAAQAPLAFVRLALQQGRTVRVTVAEAAALAGSDPYFLAQGPAAILCTPLAAHGHTVALLLLEQAQGARAATAASGESSVAVDGFEAADALYVELLGATAALLVENSHLRRRLVDATGARGTAGADPSAWLLGTMRVVHRGQEITPQLQGRVRDLVALLLLQPADMPITRAEIAAAFWPDTAEAQALTNVRNLLHKLRTAWPDAAGLLEFGRQQIQWKPDVGAWIDVHVFRRGLAEATRLDAGAAVHLLRASVALYNGGLLPGANDEWVQPLRERLHGQYLEALSRLAGLLIDQHDFAGALHYARLLLSADPLREESYRHLLRAQALAGDPAAAQQTYAACAAMLAAEFGASPSPATEAIYRQYITQA